MRRIALAIVTLAAACSDKPYDPSGPAIDPNAPRVHITSPMRGTFAGDVKTITVTGDASDDVGVASVTVNGVAATLAADGTWTATVPVTAGTNLLHAIATDAQGNAGKESRAVVAGPMAKIDMQVPDALTAALSAQTFNALGRGLTGYLINGDLESVIAPHNPVVDVGGGPDCLYAQGAVTSVKVGGATTVTLTPQSGGLGLSVQLDQLNVGMHLNYAAACIDGSRDITISASHVSITGMLAVGVKQDAFDIQLTNQNVTITGFNVDLGGIPGAVVDLLHLDTALGPILGWATEKFVVPMLNNALAGLNNTKTIDVLGTPVDVSVKPSSITFDVSGALVKLNTTLRAQGDAMAPGYVFVPNTAPAMDTSHGFQLAIADDAANQLLASFWAAKGMDKTFDLKTGSYGDIGKLYDKVELAAAVPPYVDATGGALKLTVGDLVATFKNGDQVATQVAINAEVDVRVTAGSDGNPRLDVGTPTTYVDILDENVDGANELSTAQFEVISSFALGRIIAVGSGSIGAIPLPAFGGVAVQNLSIAEQTGYLVVDGEVQ